jgi:hypothetical protein
MTTFQSNAVIRPSSRSREPSCALLLFMEGLWEGCRSRVLWARPDPIEEG